MPAEAIDDEPDYVRCDACDGEGSIPEYDRACECVMWFPCRQCDGTGEMRDAR